MSAVFRLVRPSDLPALVTLINLAYRVEDFFINGNRTNETDVRYELEHGLFIVAEDRAGDLAGCVHVAVRRDRGHFGMLSVHPAHQGSGLGKALVAAAEDHCREHGCTTMELEVVNLREELPPWYRRLGYVESGTSPFPAPEKQKLPCHFIVMSKPLAPLAVASATEATP